MRPTHINFGVFVDDLEQAIQGLTNSRGVVYGSTSSEFTNGIFSTDTVGELPDLVHHIVESTNAVEVDEAFPGWRAEVTVEPLWGLGVMTTVNPFELTRVGLFNDAHERSELRLKGLLCLASVISEAWKSLLTFALPYAP